MIWNFIHQSLRRVFSGLSRITRRVTLGKCHFYLCTGAAQCPIVQCGASASGAWLPDLIAKDNYGCFHGKNPEQGASDTAFPCCWVEMQRNTDRRASASRAYVFPFRFPLRVQFCVWLCPSKGVGEVFNVGTGRRLLLDKTRLMYAVSFTNRFK